MQCLSAKLNNKYARVNTSIQESRLSNEKTQTVIQYSKTPENKNQIPHDYTTDPFSKNTPHTVLKGLISCVVRRRVGVEVRVVDCRSKRPVNVPLQAPNYHVLFDKRAMPPPDLWGLPDLFCTCRLVSQGRILQVCLFKMILTSNTVCERCEMLAANVFLYVICARIIIIEEKQIE